MPSPFARSDLTLLDRYVAGQLIRPMLAILVAALLVLLAERMLRVVDIVVGWRGSLIMIFEILGYLVPAYMGLALPGALFIAILITVGRLSRDGELDAMLASGRGFFALLRPLLVTGFVLALLNLVVQSHVHPYSRYAYRAALHALSSVSFQVLLREGRFATLGDTTYMVERIDPSRESFGGLFLATERPGGDLVTITADTGKLVPASGADPVLLELHDGLQQLTPRPAPEAPAGRSTTLRFRTFLSDVQGSEPEALSARGEDERELTLPELAALPDGDPAREIEPAEVEAEFHVRLVRVVATFVLPLVAAPLAVARRRSRRSWGFLIGVALLLVFNQVVQFGKTLADDEVLPVAAALWLPLLLFCALGLRLTALQAGRVPSGGDTWLERALDRLASVVTSLFTGGRGRGRAAAAA